MKKNLIFLIKKKINETSNFYNCLIQLNVNFIYFKIFKKNYYTNIINIVFLDSFYKINRFLKLIRKYLMIKIFSLNKNYIIKLKFFNNNKIKFYKKFVFINKQKNFFIIINFKKCFYINSILNNFFYILN